jgi:hypothetical protein
MRTATAVAAVGVGVLALGLGLAGPAAADDGGAAVVQSPSTGDGYFEWGYNGQQTAESDALSDCAKEKHTDCVIAASSPQCVAVATSPSNPLAYAGGSGATADTASSVAVTSLQAKGYSDAHVLKGNTACAWDPTQ